LFSDTNANGTFQAGTDVAALDSSGSPITTTTNASGVYTFANLTPGSYFVVIPQSQFGTGGVAQGFVVSGSTPAGNNNVNKGSNVVGTGVVTSLVNLTAGGAPVTDGDTDANTDLSFDIGVVPQFDLTVAKTTTATVAATGSTITYTVTARNNGPSDATGVTLTDDIPNGIRVISATSSLGTETVTIPASASDTDPANNTQDLSVTIGTLVPSATTQRTYTIVAEILPITTGTGAPANIVNSATIAGDGTELTALANTASVSLPVQLRNDLVALKTITTNPASTATPAIAAPGTTITYTITGRNDGPSRASAVRIVDNIPDGIRILTATSSDNTDPAAVIPASAQDTTAANPDDIEFTLGDLLVGAGNQTTITITAVVLATTTGLFTNTAVISSTATTVNEDTNPNNNTGSIQANAQRSVDLEVVKSIVTNPASTSTPATAAPGSTITYTVLARNNGPLDATTVRVVDNIPDGIRVLTAVSSDNTDTVTIPASAQDTTPLNGDDITIDVGNLAVGTAAQTTITITAVVLPGTIGTFTNTATTSATDTVSNVEAVTTNNTSSVVANSPRTVDLTVSKNGPTTAIAGNTITYTMTATNNGPSDAVSVQVADNIPDGIRIVSATINGNAITIPASASDTTAANPDDLIFTVGNLATGANNNTITIVAAILPGTTGSLVNSAVVSTTDTNTTETPTNNNAATVTTTLTAQNDVRVTKSGPPGVTAGSQLTYTMNVTNDGPSTATSVNVVDTLPAGFTFVSGTSLIGATTAGTVTSGTNNTANVTIPTLAPGETAVVSVIATVGSNVTGTLTNTVTINAVNDSVATNNTATAPTVVTAPPNVDLSGRIYIDSNNDGSGQTTENGFSNVTVTLNGTPTGSTTPITPRTTTTDASGAYTFTGLVPGSYSVQVPDQTDFNFRASNPGSTGGTAGTRMITGINVASTNSTVNNIGFTRVFSKRMFLASSATTT
jgi:trimeric autotransporter adhesin